jgi:NADPH:quinone reductase-like Zn-dependent oxidoreductase
MRKEEVVRAAVIDRYGPPDVVRVAEVRRPRAGKDQVLVRVEAAAVTSADARIRGARFPPGFAPMARLALGLRRPRRAVGGSAFAGVVEDAGAKVDGVAPGQRVAGMTGMAMGAHAEYLAVAARRVVEVPEGVAPDDAAGVLFGGTTALWFLRDRAGVTSGSRVLVVGASGAIGTNAVQLARHLGATVCGVTSTPNVALVSSLGAERVLDYTTTTFDTLDERFDAVFDTVGALSVASGRRLLAPGGKLLLAVAGLGDTVRKRRAVATGTSPERAEDFRYLLDLVARGILVVVNERTYQLDEMAEAHRRIDGGHKVGNLLVHP